MPEPIISVAHVSKAYRIWESPAARLTAPLLEAAAKIIPGAQGLRARAARRYRDFWALKDVSLEVGRGEAVGIIGRNGSGKSTLLQLIVGTLQPTEGTVQVKGRVAALLELGSGFNPDFTGRENVYLNGAVLGLNRAEIDARFEAMAAFAEIGDFMDQPVKTYSSGMMLRLAFAVQTAVEPDILIIDEALGVGDFFFQQKCAARMRALRERGTTLLFVSHDMASVRDLCQRALYLRKGATVCFGASQDTIARYFSEDDSPAGAVAAAAIAAAPTKPGPVDPAHFRAQALWWADSTPAAGAKLLGVALFDAAGHPTTQAKMGQTLRVQLLFTAAQAGRYHAAIELKNRFDQVITSISSYTCGLDAQELAAGDAAVLELALTLNFEAGRYTLQALLAADNTRPNQATRLDSSPWVGPLEIHWDYANERAPFLGQFGPPATARFLHEPAH